MKYRKDLKIKYLTDTYKIIDGYPLDSTDVMFTLISEIKQSRRTKKTWKASDYVFPKQLFLDTFHDDSVSPDINDQIYSELINDGCILENSETLLVSITNKGLSLIFKL